MPPKRATLRDRNAAAIAATPTPLTPLQPAVTTPEASVEAPQADGPPKPAAVTDRAVLSVTVRPEDLEDAKAAYMADWLREGRYDGFPKWLGAAIRRHAELTPTQRAQIESERPAKATSRGLKRAFQMEPAVVDELRASIRRDLEVSGRYSSEADWVGDAMRQAIAEARANAGGVLPPAPRRLPNRMPPR